MAWFYRGRKYWYHNGKRYSSRIKRKKYKNDYILKNRMKKLKYLDQMYFNKHIIDYNTYISLSKKI